MFFIDFSFRLCYVEMFSVFHLLAMLFWYHLEDKHEGLSFSLKDNLFMLNWQRCVCFKIQISFSASLTCSIKPHYAYYVLSFLPLHSTCFCVEITYCDVKIAVLIIMWKFAATTQFLCEHLLIKCSWHFDKSCLLEVVGLRKWIKGKNIEQQGKVSTTDM